ncbi:endonuclease/exonuclease/phosphatase family protein [Aliiglaciecola sp. 2_MG-2023]|uniref:endonuclease/exonuclease/phosphatase family protein n=1 Tax=unclassified Aliiglaciecola TaxID=2593648 RepID=UPI0026E13DE0|nr:MULTISPECIES: endonuclease/exonuclease/phosphatase family protein [unclassified Aliiglaciecola]MDO6711277.1 endonuclease/exonuclease/phosphatase family protein [Aliiglaciecola sp. 2_MG-2023]MDO6752274.1 endonuclease/exonuclease/phosphatase family protein [Aliiglaciecola sp. 1_MG-2023]
MPIIFTVLLMFIPLTAISAENTIVTANLSTNRSVDFKPDAAAQGGSHKGNINVLSWNVSGDAFVKSPEVLKALVARGKSNILLLDEVSPLTNKSHLYNALPKDSLAQNTDWHINFGSSGGRQRNVVISRFPHEVLPEFSNIIPYPKSEKKRIHQRMINAGDVKYANTLDDGIAVNGVILLEGGNRLLVVSADLECCGSDPSSWAEDKRRIEAREIRRLIGKVIERTHVDGIILAGDFNLVSTVMPLLILSGPYSKPHFGLIAAELKHLDGKQTWTWDGRGKKFPSRVMDLVIYSPNRLQLVGGYIFDPDDITATEKKSMGIQSLTFSKLSEHLPVITHFEWR